MHIKFLPHGTGSGERVIEYLLGKVDHQGQVRPEITVLRGNPTMVADVVDSLEFKNRYTSGVIAWSPNDNPTDKEIEAVLKDFEEVAFAGLKFDRYSWTAVKHGDHNGGVHVHIVAARVDLETNRSLNIAPPGWQKDFDPLRDYHNYRNDWARPDDPQRTRLYHPGCRLFLDKTNNPKEMLTNYLVNCIEAGTVKNRTDIKKQLSAIGEITREGKNYISIKPKGFSKAIRLKGGIYDAKFDARAGRLVGKKSSTRDDRSRDNSRGRATEAREHFKRAIARRSKYNIQRYRKNQNLIQESIERVGNTKQKTEEINLKAMGHVSAHVSNNCFVVDSWLGKLDVLSGKENNQSRHQDRNKKGETFQLETDVDHTKQGGEQPGKPDIETARNERNRSDGQQGGDLPHLYRQNKKQTGAVPEYRESLGCETKLEVKNDRDKKYARKSIRGVTESLQRRRGDIIRADTELHNKSRKLVFTGERLRTAADGVYGASDKLFRAVARSIMKLKILRKIVKKQRLSRTQKNAGLQWNRTNKKTNDLSR
jgi:MobA/VirD2-like, nuclease domain